LKPTILDFWPIGFAAERAVLHFPRNLFANGAFNPSEKAQRNFFAVFSANVL